LRALSGSSIGGSRLTALPGPHREDLHGTILGVGMEQSVVSGAFPVVVVVTQSYLSRVRRLR
jgi:hypothetical protein